MAEQMKAYIKSKNINVKDFHHKHVDDIKFCELLLQSLSKNQVKPGLQELFAAAGMEVVFDPSTDTGLEIQWHLKRKDKDLIERWDRRPTERRRAALALLLKGLERQKTIQSHYGWMRALKELNARNGKCDLKTFFIHCVTASSLYKQRAAYAGPMTANEKAAVGIHTNPKESGGEKSRSNSPIKQQPKNGSG